MLFRDSGEGFLLEYAEVTKGSNVTVCKTVAQKGYGGSNPPLSTRGTYIFPRKEVMCMNDKEISHSLGQEFGRGLRGTSQYEQTRARMEREGLSWEILNKTPPVGVNLQLLSEMSGIKDLATKLAGRPLNLAMLGLANIDGVEDTQRFVSHALDTSLNAFHVVDIDPDIIKRVFDIKRKNRFDHLKPLLRDARHTELADRSIDVIIRDHTGNCCPPEIDRAIDRETARILRPGGTSIVNISTSELLPSSKGRQQTPINNKRIAHALRSTIYDLSQFKNEFGVHMEMHRGNLLEIEKPGGFVIFGEDQNGHGEWFRSLGDHIKHWLTLGFDITDIKTRFGQDSHDPALICMRHNVVLTKKE